MSRRRWACALVLLASSSGCAYLRDRALDLTDVVDPKFGYGGGGLGAKVEATTFVGAGLGLGQGWDDVEYFGREARSRPQTVVAQLVLLGADGVGGPCSMDEFDLGFVNVMSEPPPAIDRARFGGEVWLPLVHVGLYANAGELLDFVAGIFGADLAHDDGVAKRSARPDETSRVPEDVPRGAPKERTNDPQSPNDRPKS